MKVLVTGGSGKLGRQVVLNLVEHGHEVMSVDRLRPASGGASWPSGADFREVDLLDVGQVAGAMVGCEAVVHLGAIPGAYSHADEVVFRNNTGGTYSVLQAAMLLGVRKAVIASSLSALGGAYALPPFPPRYAPVDEAHPLEVKDPYGLSKEVDERTAEMFVRRTGMTVLAYRFHTIVEQEEAVSLARHYEENPDDGVKILWGYIDVRDAAEACRLGAESEGFGFEAFNIVAADTLSTMPIESLIKAHCPELELRENLVGSASAFSIRKARELLGWEPKHSWREDLHVET